MPVGIQGCAELFIEDDGVCHPSMDKCPAGTIPRFAEGCVPVGIQGCAALFMEDDGLCHPSMAKCQAGTIPKFDEGCVPVGIQGCNSAFVEQDGLCHPSMDKCPAGTFALPLEGCVPVDGPAGCGSGTWGNIAGTSGTVWVNPAYGSGGDGSQAKPVVTIAEALALVSPGGRVALAAGTYAEPVTLDKAVEIIGRCPSLVAITGTQVTPYLTDPVIVLVDQTSGAKLTTLRLSGAGLGVLAVLSTAKLTGVHIDQTAGSGVFAALLGTQLELDHTLVAHTAAIGGAGGEAVTAVQGAAVTLDACALVGNREAALLVAGAGTSATIGASLIEGTLSQPSTANLGFAIQVQGGATVTVASSSLRHNRTVALSAAGSGTSASVETSIIDDTLPQESNLAGGVAAQATSSASLTVAKSALYHNRTAGLLVAGVGTSAAVSATLFDGTQPQESDLAAGLAIQVTAGASLALGSSALRGNHVMALMVQDAGTSAVVTSSLVEGTLPHGGDATGGFALAAVAAASLSLSSSALVANRFTALAAGQPGTVVTVSSTLIEGTLPQASDSAGGRGIEVGDGASLTLDGSVLEGNRDAAIVAGDLATTVTVGSTLIRDTLPQAQTLKSGRALTVYGGVALTIESSALVHNRDLAVSGGQLGTAIEITGTLIEDTLPRGSDLQFGQAVQVQDQATLTIHSSAVRGNHLVGVAAVGGGTSAEVAASVIENTLTQESDGAYGVGVEAAYEASILLEGSLVRDSRTAGVLAGFGAALDVNGCVIEDVLAGKFYHYDGPQGGKILETFDGVGDCLVAAFDASVTIDDTHVTGCQRAALLHHDSGGTLTSVASQDSRYGLVLQGAPLPDYDDPSNSFSGTEQDILVDGDLPVPEPPPLPED